MKKHKAQPVDDVQWVHRDSLVPNNYNPNSVAPPELDLLEISILEDGWTQPIVINPDSTIVDGFHRWTVSGRKRVYALTGGMVPTVKIDPKDLSSQQMATIRHNRARGTHAVLKMSTIMKDMADSGLTAEEIMQRLQMEKDEVVRLLAREGIPKSAIFKDGTKGFSPSWTPE